MSIGVTDRKLLWGRAQNECAYSGCSEELLPDLGDAASSRLEAAGVVIGEEAHIRSKKLDGPRHEPAYPSEKLDSYENLILLCPTHHTLVDKDKGRGFTVEDLVAMKKAHELSCRRAESESDRLNRRTGELVAARVQTWEEQLGLKEWEATTWGLNLSMPVIRGSRARALFTTAQWLLTQDWPEDYPLLRQAFIRLREVLGSLTQLISDHFERVEDGDGLQLERTHKRIGWNPDAYERLIIDYRLNCALTWCLVVEATKACNLVIAATRAELDPLYRFEERVLLARDGDGIIEDRLVRLEYGVPQVGAAFPDIFRAGLVELIAREAQRLQVQTDELDPYALMDGAA